MRMSTPCSHRNASCSVELRAGIGEASSIRRQRYLSSASSSVVSAISLFERNANQAKDHENVRTSYGARDGEERQIYKKSVPRRRVLLILALASAFAWRVHAEAWPTHDWLVDSPESQGVDSAKLEGCPRSGDAETTPD